MSRFIKYFDGGRRNMSFLSVNGEIIKKFNKIWKQTINTYGHELDSQPVFDKKYMKPKLKKYVDKVNTHNETPREKIHYFCNRASCVDSVLETHEENYPQVYFEQCKFRLKRNYLLILLILN